MATKLTLALCIRFFIGWSRKVIFNQRKNYIYIKESIVEFTKLHKAEDRLLGLPI